MVEWRCWVSRKLKLPYCNVNANIETTHRAAAVDAFNSESLEQLAAAEVAETQELGELYEIYLSGDLKPSDEPKPLLEAALENFKYKKEHKNPKARGQGTRQRTERTVDART